MEYIFVFAALVVAVFVLFRVLRKADTPAPVEPSGPRDSEPAPRRPNPRDPVGGRPQKP